MTAMAANGYIVDFRRSARSGVLEPTRDRVECDWSASSHPGNERSHNEDAWHVAPDAGVFVVADGMGGYNAGEVASQLAVERLALGLVREVEAGRHDGAPIDSRASDPATAFVSCSHHAAHSPDRTAILDREIGAANAEILAAAARRPECLGMATTLACLWIDERRFCVAHIGNSRVYLLRGTRFSRLTRDHSLGQALSDAERDLIDQRAEPSAAGAKPPAAGAEPRVDAAKPSAAGNGRARPARPSEQSAGVPHSPCAERAQGLVLTRVLGVEPIVDPEVRQSDWFHGDRLLICSDGLSNSVSDARIADVMQCATSAAECVDTLISASLAADCRDNVTAVAVFLSRSFTAV